MSISDIGLNLSWLPYPFLAQELVIMRLVANFQRNISVASSLYDGDSK